MPSAATRSSSMGSSNIEFALDLEDIAARAAKVDRVGVLACGHARQHVWSHFCLCFKDEKMTDDKATLRAFGIKDGDEATSYSLRQSLQAIVAGDMCAICQEKIPMFTIPSAANEHEIEHRFTETDNSLHLLS
ncbi:hypothetical protein D1007_25522 [Hordeum vulgare]|nr:hypothetical protein D1007_25522 [Hordeum vulgare]